MYEGDRVTTRGQVMEIDLIPLEPYDFDVIIEMDLLGRYKAQMDCCIKILTI